MQWFTEKYFNYLSENNMVFSCGDVLGIFDGKGENIVPYHCVYATKECAVMGVDKEFLESLPKSCIENWKVSNDVGTNYIIRNHDYSLVTQKYNTITEEIDYNNHANVIEKLNYNIDIKNMAFTHTDIEDILEQYGTGSTPLYLKKWIHSNKHNIPTLEGMDMKEKIFVSISDI